MQVSLIIDIAAGQHEWKFSLEHGSFQRGAAMKIEH
jgi:hypothetical protein